MWIFACIFFVAVVTRFIYLIFTAYTGKSKINCISKAPAKTLICIGSGGHTTEMLLLIKKLDSNSYTPRIYVLADSDKTSLIKIQEQETTKYEVVQIPRSRSVKQSYITSIFTTFYAILFSAYVMIKIRPKLILCNGPGTCVPLILVGFLMKCLFMNITLVFIESICRVESLSLTGKILIYIVDIFVVQSKQLASKIPRCQYFGRLL